VVELPHGIETRTGWTDYETLRAWLDTAGRRGS
jgi:hypothetical protein